MRQKSRLPVVQKRKRYHIPDTLEEITALLARLPNGGYFAGEKFLYVRQADERIPKEIIVSLQHVIQDGIEKILREAVRLIDERMIILRK